MSRFLTFIAVAIAILSRATEDGLLGNETRALVEKFRPLVVVRPDGVIARALSGAAIERAGAVAVLIDIEPGGFTMDPTALEAALQRPPPGRPANWRRGRPGGRPSVAAGIDFVGVTLGVPAALHFLPAALERLGGQADVVGQHDQQLLHVASDGVEAVAQRPVGPAHALESTMAESDARDPGVLAVGEVIGQREVVGSQRLLAHVASESRPPGLSIKLND